MRRDYPATGRNRAPILEVLRELLPARCSILEVASGSGQHGAWFTRQEPGWTWQPSDADPGCLASCAAWRQDGGPGLLAPIALNVTRDWRHPADAIFCANMIHIAPWEAALGLFAGAARSLEAGSPLVLYGPFKLAGEHTAPSNARFDASLRAQDPRWGVRDLAEVERAAEGLALERRVAMPANNQTVVLRRL